MVKKIKLKISSRLLKKRTRKSNLSVKKHCRFCGEPEQVILIDYKNGTFLRGFLTERGKILPLRISGNCSKHQRLLSTEIKKSRSMALVPYCATQY